MANDKIERSNSVRELEELVASLPRTDGMTLPAVQIVKIDDEAIKRSEEVVAINAATKAEDVINSEGKTLGEVRNEAVFGMKNPMEGGEKHTFKDGEDGSFIIVPPTINGEKQDDIVIKPTPPNVAAVDAGILIDGKIVPHQDEEMTIPSISGEVAKENREVEDKMVEDKVAEVKAPRFGKSVDQS